MSQIRSLMGLMDEARRQIEYVCEEMLGPAGEAAGAEWRPPTDVYECDDCVVVKMEVAGLRQGDTDITVEGDVITIRGERTDRCPMQKKFFHRMEVRYGRFDKRIRLGMCFDAENIDARIEEGFLTLVIPKCEPAETTPVKAHFRV